MRAVFFLFALICYSVAQQGSCFASATTTINICASCYYYLPGFYTSTVETGSYSYNVSAFFQSHDNDDYKAGWYNYGCNVRPCTSSDADYTYFQTAESFSGDLTYSFVSIGYSLFPLGGIQPAIHCQNTIDHCSITVSSFKACSTPYCTTLS